MPATPNSFSHWLGNEPEPGGEYQPLLDSLVVDQGDTDSLQSNDRCLMASTDSVGLSKSAGVIASTVSGAESSTTVAVAMITSIAASITSLFQPRSTHRAGQPGRTRLPNHTSAQFSRREGSEIIVPISKSATADTTASSASSTNQQVSAAASVITMSKEGKPEGQAAAAAVSVTAAIPTMTAAAAQVVTDLSHSKHAAEDRLAAGTSDSQSGEICRNDQALFDSDADPVLSDAGAKATGLINHNSESPNKNKNGNDQGGRLGMAGCQSCAISSRAHCIPENAVGLSWPVAATTETLEAAKTGDRNRVRVVAAVNCSPSDEPVKGLIIGHGSSDIQVLVNLLEHSRALCNTSGCTTQSGQDGTVNQRGLRFQVVSPDKFYQTGQVGQVGKEMHRFEGVSRFDQIENTRHDVQSSFPRRQSSNLVENFTNGTSDPNCRILGLELVGELFSVGVGGNSWYERGAISLKTGSTGDQSVSRPPLIWPSQAAETSRPSIQQRPLGAADSNASSTLQIPRNLGRGPTRQWEF
jgi:hypothetical protein